MKTYVHNEAAGQECKKYKYNTKLVLEKEYQEIVYV